MSEESAIFLGLCHFWCMCICQDRRNSRRGSRNDKGREKKGKGGEDQDI